MNVAHQIDELKRASALLDVALELTGEARSAWLNELGIKEPAVAAHVKRLLNAHDRANDIAFLDQTITPTHLAISNDEYDEQTKTPQTMGPYRLIRQIGEGGMSTVWLAERDYENFTRQVAIKRLPTFLKRDEDEKRLLREASILASLNHPNIASLLDAGISAEGDPYIALELVDGEPITTYCDRLKLNLPARVKLMTNVCAAVTFLHQNSVIHRDIKPSNVLVDKAGNVKLLDFGIAKLIDNALVGDDVTRASSVSFTPEYASPEQVVGNTVTTASDVYSLGVLLYRVLTGARPYARTMPSLLIASAIVNAPPSKPSTLFGINGDLPKADLAQIAEARQTTVRLLHRHFRNDLDNVLLKALEKDVSRRYATVDAFAADLNAWLESRPVNAQKTSTWYVARKFAARHRFGVIGSATAVACLIAALAFGGWQARQTQLEAAKTKRVLNFLQTLIAEANPNKTGVQTITVLDLLQRAPEVAKAQFPKDANLQFEVLRPVERILRDLEAAGALEPVGLKMIQLIPSLKNLSLDEEVELRAEHAKTLAYLGKQAQADAAVEDMLTRLSDKRGTVAYALAMMTKAQMLNFRARYVEAANIAMEQHTFLMTRLDAKNPQRTKITHSVLETLLNADRLHDAREIEQRYFTDALIDAVPDAKERLQFQVMKGSLLWFLGDPRSAEIQYTRLLQQFKDFFGESDVMYPQLLQLVARTAIEAGNYRNAIKFLDVADVLEQKSAHPVPRKAIKLLTYQALTYLQLGELGSARDKLTLATTLINQGNTAPSIYWQAVYQEAMLEGDWPRALNALDEKRRTLPSGTSDNSIALSIMEIERANTLRLVGDFSAARKLAAKAIVNIQKIMPREHFWRNAAEVRFAQLLALSGEADAGLPIAVKASEAIEKSLGADHPLAYQSQLIRWQMEKQLGNTAATLLIEQTIRRYETTQKRKMDLLVTQLH
jgi:serine/threonine protein kinase/tetratricopeptide (TPR) repeat protein